MARVQRQLIELPYSPRPQFKPFHDRKQRFSVIVAHRRAGKTVACVNELIRGALRCKNPNPRFAYVAPLLKQAKDVAWTYLQDFSRPIPGVEFNQSELRVDFPNGGRVRLYGGDNPDSLRGIYLDGVVPDEYADMDPRLWTEVLRPALSDRQGWAAFIGTPKGRNEFAKMYEAAETNGWFRLMLKASETGILDPAELQAARLDMPAEQYAQEYECSFEAAIIGAYYGTLMATAMDEGRITRVPYEPRLQVETWWDLGIGDAMAIWFVQRVNAEIRFIDYHEMSGEGLPYYAKVLQERPYVYSRHIAPHDIAVRELGTGKSRLEAAEALGIKFDVAPMLPIDDGIQSVRAILPRSWWDAEKCARGIECMRQYRKDFDERLKVFRDHPRHDWASHGADAARTGAVMSEPVSAGGKIDYPKVRRA